MHSEPRPTLDDRLRARNRPADRRPMMHHAWRDLLFLHWRVDPERIQRTLPPGLTVDVFDGAAYVGIVPFFMCDIRPRGLPAMPGLSNFMELNVRTYVHDAQGTPGVWFYSLDCNSRLTVWGARRFFHLPYRLSAMWSDRRDGVINYHSQVRGENSRCVARYTIDANRRTAEPGTLEFFLVERYLLFAAAGDGRLFNGRVVHAPYPVADAQIAALDTNLLAEHDFDITPGTPPDHVCGSRGVEVDVYGLAAANQT